MMIIITILKPDQAHELGQSSDGLENDVGFVYCAVFISFVYTGQP